MTSIEDKRQLRTLERQFAMVQGAMAMAQEVQASAQEQVKRYLEAVALVAGVELGDGDQVTVNWDTGEVQVDHRELAASNGVAHQ